MYFNTKIFWLSYKSVIIKTLKCTCIYRTITKLFLFIIFIIGWNIDFDLPDAEGSTADSELTTITASLPTSVTSSSVTITPPTTSVCTPTVSYSNKVRINSWRTVISTAVCSAHVTFSWTYIKIDWKKSKTCQNNTDTGKENFFFFFFAVRENQSMDKPQAAFGYYPSWLNFFFLGVWSPIWFVTAHWTHQSQISVFSALS